MKYTLILLSFFISTASIFAQEKLLISHFNYTTDKSLERRVEFLESRLEELSGKVEQNTFKMNGISDKLDLILEKLSAVPATKKEVVTENNLGIYPTQWYKDTDTGVRWRYTGRQYFQREDTMQIYRIQNPEYFHQNQSSFYSPGYQYIQPTSFMAPSFGGACVGNT